MSTTLRPETPAQLREAVAWAAAEDVQLELRGRGTKRGFGRPMQTEHVLDLSALAGIDAYEPEELVLTCAAGTPIAEIETLLAGKRQLLGFEPPDLGPLYGGADGGTIGGVLAANLAGPRRVKLGAARDHFLGFSGVSGRGEAFKAGGRVVKNVTGYDLAKLVAGSFGTLAAVDMVTVKVLPAPDKTRTVLVFDLDDAAAIAVLVDALNSPYEVSGAAYLPTAAAGRSGVEYVRKAGVSVAAVRVEGTAVSVAGRCAALRTLFAGRGPVEELHSMNSAKLWREIRDVAVFLPDREKAIWRVSAPPCEGPRVARATGGDWFCDWGGGLVWLATAVAGDGGAAAIRGALAAVGGHATLVRAADPLRAAVPVFEPQAPALAALSKRVKESFDPRRILNPGRMYAGV
ncbi:MAG: glycolate oxidase subunit GlcE [Rhodospirillales bacterium]|nr:glycolate oxidase subunit GlcE [Rhodospirillales bacterium]